MLAPQRPSSGGDPFTTTPNKQPLCSGRSMQSSDSFAQRSKVVTPWQGDEYYSRIKKSIQQSTRAKSATIKSVKLKAYDNRAKMGFTKMNTVQIELTPLPNQPIKKSITKWTQAVSASQVIFRESYNCTEKQPSPQKQYKLTTVSFLEPDPIHQRKLSLKSIQPKIKTVQRMNTEVSRKVVETSAAFGEKDKKKSLLFFFEVRNHSIVNREKMVMRLRNIEKGRASKAINHLN